LRRAVAIPLPLANPALDILSPTRLSTSFESRIDELNNREAHLKAIRATVPAMIVIEGQARYHKNAAVVRKADTSCF
jgi:hypothetical protein